MKIIFGALAVLGALTVLVMVGFLVGSAIFFWESRKVKGCPVCKDRFKNDITLKNHLAMNHPEFTPGWIR